MRLCVQRSPSWSTSRWRPRMSRVSATSTGSSEGWHRRLASTPKPVFTAASWISAAFAWSCSSGPATAKARRCRWTVVRACASRLRARIRRRGRRAQRSLSRRPGTGCSSRRTASASSAAIESVVLDPDGNQREAHRLSCPAMPGARVGDRSRIVWWLCSWLRSLSASSSSKRWSGCSPAPERARAGLWSSKGRRGSANRVCSRPLGRGGSGTARSVGAGGRAGARVAVRDRPAAPGASGGDLGRRRA